MCHYLYFDSSVDFFPQGFDSPGISLCLTPRRSPRLADKARKVIEPQKEMDVFVFEAIKAKTGEPKLSKTSTILHDVSQRCDIAKLKDRLLTMDSSTSSIFVPATACTG